MNILKSLSFVLVLLLASCSAPVREENGLAQEIYDALEAKDLNRLMKVVRAATSINNLNQFHDSEGNNVLHLIVQNNAIDDFLELSKQHTLPYNRYNNEYETPLAQAVDRGYCQLFELMMIKGSDPLFTPEGKLTLLSQSIIQKRYPCVETLLINSEALNQTGPNEWEALHYASYLDDLKAAKLLTSYHPQFEDTVPIDQGVPFVNPAIVPGIGDLNPFHLAVLKAHLSMAKFLAKVHPAYLTTVTTNGTTNQELAKISESPNMIVWIGSQTKNLPAPPANNPATSVEPPQTPAPSVNSTPVFDDDMQNISREKNKTKKRKRAAARS